MYLFYLFLYMPLFVQVFSFRQFEHLVQSTVIIICAIVLRMITFYYYVYLLYPSSSSSYQSSILWFFGVSIGGNLSLFAYTIHFFSRILQPNCLFSQPCCDSLHYSISAYHKRSKGSFYFLL